MQLQDYISQVQNLVHDTTGADFTTAQLTSYINNARQRVAMDTHCVRGFVTGLNTITQQEQYYYSGVIGGINLVAGGSGYVSPTVSILGGGGTGAAATATVSGGIITGINMTNWGTGYSSTPTVSITDGSGTGASATATGIFNTLDILSIAILWGDLRITLDWLDFTTFQAFCRAYSFTYRYPGVWTIHQGIGKIFTYPISDQPYPMEWDLITMPNPLVDLTDEDTQIQAPWNDAVQYYAAFLAVVNLQNYEMAKFWYNGKDGVYDMRVRQLPATAFSRRILNPYRTGLSKIRRM